MRTLARRRDVPADGPFYRHLDTVVCLYPAIPAGSELDRFEHVDVIGYDQLVDRLAAPGPRPPGTTRTGTPSPGTSGCTGLPGKPGGEGQTRESRRRGRLPPAVHGQPASQPARARPVTARVDGAAEASALNAIVSAAEAGRTVTVTGPSGGGKSHAARHAALALAGRDRLPIWVRCSEYARGRFSVLLARATAPYTVDQPLELIRRAWDAGAAPVLILDGLNECPSRAGRELLEQLAAARLRVPCGVVITSAAEVPLPDTSNVSHVELQLPGASRTAGAAGLLRRRRLSRFGRVPDPARTRPGRRVRRRARPGRRQPPTCSTRTCGGRADGPVRSALRLLAAEMDAKVRSYAHGSGGLPAPGTRADAPAAPAVDTVLGCPLLAVGQGRVSFRHEQFGRFLTAEHLVISAPDPAALAPGLEDPRHADLRELAVGIERDDDRRFGLLLALADERLLVAAEAGQFGTGISDPAAGRGRRRPHRGQGGHSDRGTAPPRLKPRGIAYGGRWRMPAPRNARQAALLTATGRWLRRGSFLSEVAALLDATDTRCAAEMRRLREEGYSAAGQRRHRSHLLPWLVPIQPVRLPAGAASCSPLASRTGRAAVSRALPPERPPRCCSPQARHLGGAGCTSR